jgi:hypothetical protein
VNRVINGLIKQGAKVVHKSNAMVHVSGHASAGELLTLYNIVKPRHVMPVHGEWRHLRANASLAEATQGSGSFDAELAALERLMPLSAEVRALKPFAEGGAPSRAALAAEFDAAAAKASLAARDPGETGGFLARLRHALSSIVSIRQVGSTTGDAPDAVLARADAAVAEGDIAGALTLLRGLPPKAAQAMAPWQSRALQRVAVDRQVAAIRSRALSDLVDVTREQP